ncbi:MAG: hypothetical protein DRI90_18235 [Deltaproteobacteria bacterium]|nr:MAG: hypothetical protein DRI90_18235 [Deltaproteobacteria bacterium]
MAKGSGERAVLGAGLQVRGRVRGDGDLCIKAVIEGDVTVSGALELSAGAKVNGAVEADSLVVAGALEGDVTARGVVAIAATGSVSGNIAAGELSMDEGASFVGRVDADFDLPEAIA